MTHMIIIVAISIASFIMFSTAAPAAQPSHAQPAVELPDGVLALDAAGLESLIRSRAGDLPIIRRTRIFEGGHEVPVVKPLPLDFQVAENDILNGTITVFGSLGGREYVEEIRMTDSGGAFFVIVDRYLESDDDRVGRSTPAFLHAGEDALVQAHDAKVSTMVKVILPVVKTIGGKTIDSTGLIDGKASIFTQCSGKKYAYKWNGWTGLNDRRGVLTWEVNGENFGDAIGKVFLDNKEVPLATSKSWSKTRVVVDPMHSGLRVAQPSQIKLTTATGNSTTYIVSTIPALAARLLDQCTYFTARRRLDMGKSIPGGGGGAYSGFSSVTATYVPKPGHVFKTADNGHQVIIVSVAVDNRVASGTKRWTLSFEDQNYDCRQSMRSWKSSFAVKSGKVVEYPRIKADTTSAQLTQYWP